MSPELQSTVQLRQRIESGSQNPVDYHDLADLLIYDGFYEEAVSLYRKALNLSLTDLQKAGVFVELGWTLHQYFDQTGEALMLSKSALSILENERESPEVLFYKGESYALCAFCLWSSDSNCGTEAARLGLAYLGRIIIESPDRGKAATAYCDAARLHILLGNKEAAINLCQECLLQDLSEQDRLLCLIVIVEAFRLAGRFIDAKKALEDGLRRIEFGKGMLPWFYLMLGHVERETNQPSEARLSFQQALAALRVHPSLHDNANFLMNIRWNMAELYYEAAEYNQAATAFQEILVDHPNDSSFQSKTQLWLGRCHFKMGELAKTRDWYEKVIALPNASEGDKVSAQEGLAELCYYSGEYKQAVESFHELLIHYPKDDSNYLCVLLWLGHSYVALKAFAKARESYEEVLASQHASEEQKTTAKAGLTTIWGELDYRSGEYEEATKAFEEVLTHSTVNDPNQSGVLLYLGHCHLATGNYVRALACYEKLLASRNATEAERSPARVGLISVRWNMLRLHCESGRYLEAGGSLLQFLMVSIEAALRGCWPRIASKAKGGLE